MEEIAFGEMRMTFDEFYGLTARSFSNAINGYRKKEETLSQERFIIMRKLMFASLKPYSSNGFVETDIMQFPWEEKLVKELSQKETNELLKEIERIDNFWKNYDDKKVGKA